MSAEKNIAHVDAPKIIYTIMADFGGVYGWTIDDGIESNGVGVCHAGEGGWYGEHPISQGLHAAFVAWQAQYEEESLPGNANSFDWAAFNSQGLSLTRRLKAELGNSVRVIYEKTDEELEERREILADGRLLLLPSRRAMQQ